MNIGRRVHNLGPNPSDSILFFVEQRGRFSLQLAGGHEITISHEQIRLIADLAGVAKAAGK